MTTQDRQQHQHKHKHKNKNKNKNKHAHKSTTMTTITRVTTVTRMTTRQQSEPKGRVCVAPCVEVHGGELAEVGRLHEHIQRLRLVDKRPACDNHTQLSQPAFLRDRPGFANQQPQGVCAASKITCSKAPHQSEIESVLHCRGRNTCKYKAQLRSEVTVKLF